MPRGLENLKHEEKTLKSSVADPDPDPKDPNHFAGAGSEIFDSDPDPDPDPKHTFCSVGTRTIKSCKKNFQDLLTKIIIFYFLRKNEN